MPTEEELLKEMTNVDFELKAVRHEVLVYKDKLLEAETKLIGLKLKKEQIKNDLIRLRGSSIKPGAHKNERQEDIERFRKILPELLEKIKS